MYGQFAVLFGILFTGYFLRKTNFIDDSMNHGLNKFIVYFAYPCLIVHEIGSLEMKGSLVRDFSVMLLISIGFFAVYAVYAFFYAKARKFPKESSNVAEFAMVSPNNGFMGFSIATVFFGAEGFFLMIAHNAAMNFFFFTYGIALMRRNSESKEKMTFSVIMKSIVKLALNPNIFALVIGFAVSISGWRFGGPVGETIDTYLTYLGKVATPMAMIFIGSTLTKCKFKDMIKNRIVWEGTLNKLIILPVLTYLAVAFTPLPTMVKAMLVLGTCFPGAATVSMLAEQEKQDKQLSTMILFATTVLSVITLPISIKLINLLIM